MSEALATATSPSADVIQHVLLGGDLSRLTAAQRVSYYRAVCEAVGVNPLTRPFDYMRLSGKEVLYARKECADQLRFKHQVSIIETRADLVEGLYTVWATAKLPSGRTDVDMGAVDLGASKGEMRANLTMKAITKAKRRVTLSICGLGMLDESEVASIPGARPLNFDPNTGEIFEPDPTDSKPPIQVKAPQNSPAVQTPDPTPADQATITQAQGKKLWAIAREHQWTEPTLRQWLAETWNCHSIKEIRKDRFEGVCEGLKAGPPALRSEAF